MATEEDVMNETPDTPTAADVIAHWLWSTEGINEVPTSTVISDAEELIAALANAGYTIAGPGQVVVDRERWERVLGFAVTHDDEYCKAWGDCLQPGDLDPLPTQEGE
jgi:hypothetical protein